MIYAPNEDSNQPVHMCSLIGVFVIRTKILHFRLSKMRPVKIQISLRNAQADLNLLWAHFFEGTFSAVTAQTIRLVQGYVLAEKIGSLSFREPNL